MFLSVSELTNLVKSPIKENFHFSLIGDIHGHQSAYQRICAKSKYSLQIGDLCIDNNELNKLVHPDYHKFFGGNHDDYSSTPSSESDWMNGRKNLVKKSEIVYKLQNFKDHSVGQWGLYTIPEVISEDFSNSLFFIRGAWSIDRNNRIDNFNWFYEEELNTTQSNLALDEYCKINPNFVVSHTCPLEVMNFLDLRMSKGNIIATHTGLLLQNMFDNYAPKLWVFGHFHQNKCFVYKGTLFVCLDVKTSLNFNENLEIISNSSPFWSYMDI